jgi:hypothetical protein
MIELVESSFDPRARGYELTISHLVKLYIAEPSAQENLAQWALQPQLC